MDIKEIEKEFYGKSKTYIDMNGLCEGIWCDGDYDYFTEVIGERITFDFENQCDGFTFLKYITDFRDYLKLCLKIGNYKEEYKDYIIKSIKVYSLWILDFLSNVRIDENSEIIEGDFINYDKNDFGITFDNVLDEENRIMKDKDFFIFLLKKEHLFKNLEGYNYMFYNKNTKTVYIKFIDFIVHINYYISNKYEDYYYKISKRNHFRHKEIENNLFTVEDMNKLIEDFKQINKYVDKIKNIVENNSFKKYLKDKKKES